MAPIKREAEEWVQGTGQRDQVTDLSHPEFYFCSKKNHVPKSIPHDNADLAECVTGNAVLP